MIFPALRKNLRAGVRLACFLPVQAHDYRVSAADYATLLVFNFVLWAAAAAVHAGFAGEFSASAVPIYLAGVPLVLAAAMLIARAYREPDRLLLLATALTASDPVFELAALVLPVVAAASGLGGAVFFILLGWMWLISLRAVTACCGKRRPAFLTSAVVVSAMMAIGYFAIPRAEVWITPEEDAAPEPLAQERLFHLQGRLVEQALSSITPGKPGVPELYFVGFAPDASQDVFLSELRFVKRLFDERFGTAGRSTALASSRVALEEYPIASVTNLSRALGRVGEAMNANEDVLFLFLTAHGYEDHRLSAIQPPLELASLTPTSLSRMLQESGIKWRVIVVSACYSGGYVEPLRDDNSIVITASAADRNSFGCEHGRDFTYFGQAYFRDALAKTRSYAQAFEMAKEIVAKQEAEEKLTPSRPQMWVGPAIAARLKESAERPDK